MEALKYKSLGKCFRNTLPPPKKKIKVIGDKSTQVEFEGHYPLEKGSIESH